MAKQKRLNKNLVAFLTVMLMVVIVSVFTLVVYQQSRRDPEALAQNARESRQAGDLEEAGRRFMRAWEASENQGKPNTQYVIEAGNCLYEMGEIGRWRGLLEKTSAREPNDQSLPIALLTGLWHGLELAGGVVWPGTWADLWRDTGQKLQQLDETSVLAATSLARGLWELKGTENIATGDKAAEAAFQRAPRDPRAAMTYMVLIFRRAQADAQAAVASGQREADVRALRTKFIKDVLDVLGPALAEHPDDVPLVLTYVEYLQSEARTAAQAGDTAGAAELSAKAGAALEQAAQTNEEHRSPDLCLARAHYQLELFERAHPELTSADLADARPEIEAIASLAQQAAELDPAMYEAYNLQAELTQRFAVGAEGGELTPAERAAKSVEIYEAAKDRTLTLRNLRAQLGEGRLLMLRRGFDIVIALQAVTGAQGPLVDLARAEAFLEDARIKYPEHAVTYYMQGQLQITKGDALGAIKSLTQAHERALQTAQTQGWGAARYWFGYVRVNRLPSEQLSLLYMNRSQSGEAARYAEATMDEFKAVGLTPSVTLVATYTELLRQVGRAKDALAVLDEYNKAFPDDSNLRAVRVSVLSDLNRPDEAKKLMGQIADTGASSKLWRAQKFVEQEDYAAAESALRELLADPNATDDQFRESLQRLLDVLDRTHRRPEARALVATMLKDPPRAGLQRLLQRDEFDLAVDDPSALSADERKERDAKRLAMINETTPNPAARAQELLMYHESRGEWPEALKALEELRLQYPGELRFAEEEFHLRLRLKQFDQAGELSMTLARYDNGSGFDRAGGATYRGDLEIAKGNAEAAIREYRQAEQQLPKSSELEVKVARAYLVAGRMTEGAEALQQAVQINPRSFEGYWMLRQVYRQKAAQSFGTEKTENESLAAEAQAKATELNPNHPEVLAWKRETTEEREPLTAIAEREQRRTTDPADTANLTRLGELYLGAWRQVAEQSEESQQKVVAQADRFFQAVVPTATGDTQSALARSAAQFYSLAKRAEEGRALLEKLIAQRTGEGRVEVQILLAMFYEALGNSDAAEREYAQAQRLVREATSDVDVRRRLDMGVGMAIIRFQERQHRLDKVAEACRWLLDRLGSAAEKANTGRQVRLILIEALFNAGQAGDAEAELNDFLKLYPGDLEGLSARAQVNMRRRDYQRALADLNDILAKEPTDVLSLLGRGRIAFESGHYDKAREDLTKAEELLPRRPGLEADVRRQLATLYMRLREFDLAVTQYRTLLDGLERRGAPAEQKLPVMRQLARLLYGAMDQFETARRLISEYMEKHPTEALWPYELGRLFEVQAANAEQDVRKARERGDTAKENERREAARQSYGSAVMYYQRAAERAGDQDVRSRIGALDAEMNALTKAGRGAEAVDILRKLDFAQVPAELRGEARARLGMAVAKALQALRQDEPARKQWQQALRDASAESIALTAEIASGLQATFAQKAEATALLQAAAESVPLEDVAGQRLRLALATYLTMDGSGAAALPLVSDVLPKLSAGTPERASALLTRARAQELTGDAPGAIRTYREILTGNENDATALNNLAYLLITGDPPNYAPEEARKYADRLQGFVPGNENAGTILDTIGWVYFKNGELDKAAAALEGAVSSGGASAAVYLHLAEVYQKLNRAVDARKTLNQGLESARQNGNAEQLRELEEALKKLGQ